MVGLCAIPNFGVKASTDELVRVAIFSISSVIVAICLRVEWSALVLSGSL